MGKKARERELPENEAKAVARMLRVSPQKLNLVAQLIRGKKVATALADLEFSRKRIARDVRKCLESAIANAENNHDLDVDELVVAEAHVGKAIVIKRGSNQLLYYNGDELKRTFRVATGQSSYPTPLGQYEIVTMQRNPWWYPPEGSAWAEGAKPVPPGPGNPLGTRWMGISSPYVGIHGTPDAASIGYSASHGCIRMLIPQVEWLFQQVDVGTPVFIVPA